MHFGPILQSVYGHVMQFLQKMQCSYVKNHDHIISKFCTCHDSWAVVAYAKLWHDWLSSDRFRTKSIVTRFELCAHKHFVKWIPGLTQMGHEAMYRVENVALKRRPVPVYIFIPVTWYFIATRLHWIIKEWYRWKNIGLIFIHIFGYVFD